MKREDAWTVNSSRRRRWHGKQRTHPSDDLLDLLLVRLSLEDTPDLLHGHVFAEAERDNLVERCDEVKRVVEDGRLIRRRRAEEVRDAPGDEGERGDVLVEELDQPAGASHASTTRPQDTTARHVALSSEESHQPARLSLSRQHTRQRRAGAAAFSLCLLAHALLVVFSPGCASRSSARQCNAPGGCCCPCL